MYFWGTFFNKISSLLLKVKKKGRVVIIFNEENTEFEKINIKKNALTIRSEWEIEFRILGKKISLE